MTPFDRLQTQLVAALRQNLATRKPVPIPEAGRLLWQIFGELSSTRTYHMAGPNPIAYSEIMAWQNLFDWKLERHHLDLILAMDRAYLDRAYSQRTPSQGDVVSSREMTPELFSAVFEPS